MAKPTDLIEELNRKNKIELLTAGTFGIELEENRIDRNTGSISLKPHPRSLGSRRFNKYFQTDFSESQLEIVTNPSPSLNEAIADLQRNQIIAFRHLPDSDIIWPLSMPPKINDLNKKWIEDHFERTWYQDYRDYLMNKYNIYHLTITGVHFNWSPSPELIKILGVKLEDVLFNTAKQVVSQRWLITYLFGAAPFSENPDNLLPTNKYKQPVRSWRLSDYGQSNQNEVETNYNSLQEYEKNISNAIKDQKLFSESEFYGPARIRKTNKQYHYLELRIIDLDPFAMASTSVSRETLAFIHLVIINSIVNPHNYSEDALRAAKEINNEIATNSPIEPINEQILPIARELLTEYNQIATILDDPIYARVVKEAQESLKDPSKTLAGRLMSQISNNSLNRFAIQQGELMRNVYNNAKITSWLPQMSENIQDAWEKATAAGLPTTLLGQNKLQISYRGIKKIVTNKQLQRKSFEIDDFFPQYQNVDLSEGI